MVTVGWGGVGLTGAGYIVQMASGVIVLLNAQDGLIQVRDPSNVTTGDYVSIDRGDVTTYKYLSGAYRPMKSLNKVYMGSNAPNNVEVTIPEYFPSFPKILVAPCNLQCYDPATSGQPQTLFNQATNISYNATTGICKFTPRSELRSAPIQGTTSGVASAHQTIGEGSWGPINSLIYWTFPSCDVSLSPITIKANTGTINIIARVYAQSFGVFVNQRPRSEGDFSCTYHAFPIPINYTVYLQMQNNAGTTINYTIASGQINTSGMLNISGEPTSLYLTVNNNLTLNTNSQRTAVVWARFQPITVPMPANTPAGSTVINGTTYNEVIWPSIATAYRQAWLAYVPGTYDLPTATTLATGTLNYMAMQSNKGGLNMAENYTLKIDVG